MAHLWANWLRHPCRLGDPHRFRAGGKIRSGPQVGKVAMLPLPSRESPLLQSGGQNQKWPTSGQSGYVTPAVSGIPTALERGGRGSQVAHKWAKWLVHPCCLGGPHCFRAGGGGSEVPHLWAKWLRHPCCVREPHRFRAGGGGGSEVAHLWAKWLCHPCRLGGSPRLQSGGENQKSPTCGQSGYVTPAVSGIPTASERGAKSEVAHKWAKWVRHPCRLGDPHRFRAGGKIRNGPLVGTVASSPLLSRGSPPLQSGGGGGSEMAHKWAKWLRHPCRLGDLHGFRAGGKIRSRPLVGKVAMSPLPSRGSPMLQSGGQNQKWPTSGQSGYATRAVSGIPTTSERGAKSEMAHKWAKWLRHPCRLGDLHGFRAGGKIRSRPLVGKVAMSPLPSRGSPMLQSGGQNQKWPTSGQSGYATPAVSGIPTASERGRGKIRSGPLMGKVATSPLPSRGSPLLQSGGQNQKWPTSGQSGYATPAVWGIPTTSQRGAKSEVGGGEIRSGPLIGKVAMSPLPSRGSPPLQSGGPNQKWPTYGESGYVTPAVSGIHTAAEQGGEIRSGPLVGKVAMLPLPSRGSPPLQSGGGEIRSAPLVGKVATSPVLSRGAPLLQSGGGESEMAHLWAKWLCHPCRLGDPHCFRAGGKIRSGPQVGKVAMPPLTSRESPPLQSGGQNQKWPTSGQSGYVTPAISGIPTALERGAKSEVAHKWAKWLRHPCRLGDPNCFRAGGGGDQKWPGSGQSGYVTTAVSGIPTASKRGGKSEVARKWAKWLRHPCRLGDPHRFRAGGKIRSGPQVGKVATSPLPSRGSPPP